MKLLGVKIEDMRVVKNALDSSEKFLIKLNNNIDDAICIEDIYLLKDKMPNTKYYLIYNKYIQIGKKKIDKRIVREINKTEILNELELNWFPGLEPNFILIPESKNFKFGLYIQDTIFFLEL